MQTMHRHFNLNKNRCANGNAMLQERNKSSTKQQRNNSPSKFAPSFDTKLVIATVIIATATDYIVNWLQLKVNARKVKVFNAPYYNGIRTWTRYIFSHRILCLSPRTQQESAFFERNPFARMKPDRVCCS